jgi:hypothetical protein
MLVNDQKSRGLASMRATVSVPLPIPATAITSSQGTRPASAAMTTISTHTVITCPSMRRVLATRSCCEYDCAVMKILLVLEADILCEGHFAVYQPKEGVVKYIQHYLEHYGP